MEPLLFVLSALVLVIAALVAFGQFLLVRARGLVERAGRRFTVPRVDHTIPAWKLALGGVMGAVGLWDPNLLGIPWWGFLIVFFAIFIWKMDDTKGAGAGGATE